MILFRNVLNRLTLRNALWNAKYINSFISRCLTIKNWLSNHLVWKRYLNIAGMCCDQCHLMMYKFSFLKKTNSFGFKRSEADHNIYKWVVILTDSIAFVYSFFRQIQTQTCVSLWIVEQKNLQQMFLIIVSLLPTKG